MSKQNVILGNSNSLPLEAIGLGKTAQLIIYAISLLPFVGFVIGSNYSLRYNAATRQFGRRLLMMSVAVHAFYFLCLCPTALALSTSN